MYILLTLLLLVLFVVALVDVIIADQWRVKHLPKIFWVIIVVLMPFVGSILWFAIGRDYAHPVDRGTFGDPRRRGEAPAPGTSVARGGPGGRDSVNYGHDNRGAGNYGPRDTEAELAALEREISAYEKAERIRELEAEIEARRGKKPKQD